jgi:hypothetical protein
MPEYLCDVCGKQYKSRSGLRYHRKSHHEAAVGSQIPMPIVASELGPCAGPIIDNDAELGALRDHDLLGEACQALGVDPDDVMSFRVYPPDTVVLVHGPVGFKYIWTRGAEK